MNGKTVKSTYRETERWRQEERKKQKGNEKKRNRDVFFCFVRRQEKSVF